MKSFLKKRPFSATFIYIKALRIAGGFFLT